MFSALPVFLLRGLRIATLLSVGLSTACSPPAGDPASPPDVVVEDAETSRTTAASDTTSTTAAAPRPQLFTADYHTRPMNPGANATRRALFGDLHIHTRYSFDAFAFGTIATPSDAYRYAKGEAIKHPSGFDMQLTAPLDFYGVTIFSFPIEHILDAVTSAKCT